MMGGSSVGEVKSLRRALRSKAEFAMAEYMDCILAEYDKLLDEIIQNGGGDMLTSRKSSTYSLALLEIAFIRKHGKLNMRLAQRLSDVRGRNGVSMARVAVRDFYRKHGLSVVPSLTPKSVLFRMKIMTIQRGDGGTP